MGNSPVGQRTLRGAGIVMLAVVAAACGSSSGGGGSSAPAAKSGPASSSPAAASGGGAGAGTQVLVRSGPLGSYLADKAGKTLYLFVADKGSTSVCYGSCATYWPPLLTTGKPTAAGGAKGSLLGTTKRKDGHEEVTYAGHPLYYFAGDSKAGDTKGQGVDASGGLWWMLNAKGAAITTKAPAMSASPAAQSGGGTGY